LRAVVAVVVATLVTVGACAGCSREQRPSPGPLAMGGDRGEACMPFGVGRDLTYGFDVLRNVGHEPVSVDSVALFHAHDLRLAGAFLLPIENTTVIGNTQEWPPAGPEAAAVWTRRTPAVGARVTKEQGDLNLALHVVATSQDAGFEAVHVGYRVGTGRFLATTTTRFEVKPRCF
jgi:hypothetical protein